MTILEALEKYFGYRQFRPRQQEIIEAVISGENVLAILPTGGGKSVCYQIPALISGSFSIVISPLIALMKDQVDALNSNGRIAAFINSSIDFREADEILRHIHSGEIKLLYLAPEKLENMTFAERLKNLSPSYLFIDEAHCISEWGHNFRPSYRKISEFCKFISVNNISAFTATATPDVTKDIISQLDMKNPKIFVAGFERENLSVRVIKTNKKKIELIDLLNNYKTPAIIYAASRKRTEEIAEFLNLYKLNATCYHAGLAVEQRKYIQEGFLQDKISIIAATNAFGMGIDKKDIRLIVHYNMPGSIENYYQEIGRAGRDGELSHAFLLYDDSDKHIHKYFIDSSYPDKELIINIYNAFCDYGRIALGSPADKDIPVNYEFLSAYLKKDVSRALVSSAINMLESAGYLKPVSEYDKKTYMQFNLPSEKLKDYVEFAKDIIRDIIMILLREFGGQIINSRTQISVEKIAAKYGVSEQYVDDALTLLNNIGIADYVKPQPGNSVRLSGTRVKTEGLILDYNKIREKYDHALFRLDSMISYAYSTECRIKFIINYFGESADNFKCGKCDNCTESPVFNSSITDYLKEIILKTIYEAKDNLAETQIISILLGKTEEARKDNFPTYGSCSNYSQTELKSVVELLLSDESIIRNETNRRKLKLTPKGLELIKDKETDLFKHEPKEDSHETNLELFGLLRGVRNEAANRFQQTSYLICSDEILKKVAELKPGTPAQMLAIKGFTQRMFNKLGNDLLFSINEYMKEHKKDIETKEEKKLPGNISETLSLIKKGYSLTDIASFRKLTESVISMQIETILGFYPDTDISCLFEADHLEKINCEIERGFTDLKDLKSRLPEETGYPLIRIAVAKLKNRK
ncbi:MAG: RecQ family ATP-dependent DNA helicase [Ignavibacteria bacterium]